MSLKYEPASGEQELRLALPRLTCTMAISVAFSPDASKIATGSSSYLVSPSPVAPSIPMSCLRRCSCLLNCRSDDERICVWDARSGELLRAILNAHAGGIESVCFSPDGFHLASVGGDDGRGKIWDARSGAAVRELEDRRGDDSASIKFAPGGRVVAAGSTAGSVTLWDVESGEEALCLLGHIGRAPSLRENLLITRPA